MHVSGPLIVSVDVCVINGLCAVGVHRGGAIFSLRGRSVKFQLPYLNLLQQKAE